MTHRRPRRYSDQMQCAHCGKAWDVNDPSPPPCVTVGEVTVRRIRAMLAADRSSESLDVTGNKRL